MHQPQTVALDSGPFLEISKAQADNLASGRWMIEGDQVAQEEYRVTKRRSQMVVNCRLKSNQLDQIVTFGANLLKLDIICASFAPWNCGRDSVTVESSYDDVDFSRYTLSNSRGACTRKIF